MEKMYLFESYFYDKNNVAYQGIDGTYVSKNLQKLIDYGQGCYESRLREFEVNNLPHTNNVKEFRAGRLKVWIINDGNYEYINSVREVVEMM